MFAPTGASTPVLTHIGTFFIIIDDHLGHDTTISVIAADGTPVTLNEAAPDVVIARTSSAISTAVETRLATVGPYPMSNALYVESVSVGAVVRRRGVAH